MLPQEVVDSISSIKCQEENTNHPKEKKETTLPTFGLHPNVNSEYYLKEQGEAAI